MGYFLFERPKIFIILRAAFMAYRSRGGGVAQKKNHTHNCRVLRGNVSKGTKQVLIPPK
jgi:hypothetical protein